MNYKNEKYDHIKNFWKLDNASESQLFWQLEECGYSKCDINVLHAVRKFEDVFMWKGGTPGNSIWLMTGLPSSIEKHTPVTADEVFASLEKLRNDRIIDNIGHNAQRKYGGKQLKITLSYYVNVQTVRTIIANHSHNALFKD